MLHHLSERGPCLRVLLLLLLAYCLPAAPFSQDVSRRSLRPGPALPTRQRRALAQANLPLSSIKLPSGFSIQLYAQGFPARFLALGQADGNVTVVYVSSTESMVTALVDRHDGRGAQPCTLLSGQGNPNGVAYNPSTKSLYVAETRQITRHDHVDAAAVAGCDPSQLQSTVLVNGSVLPDQSDHASRPLGIGPKDGKLYVTVAAPFNVDVCHDPFCCIHRFNMDGGGHEIFARGIRNAAGWDWFPGSNGSDPLLLWAGMERDYLGNNRPDDILAASDPAQPGVDWGWPYCHWLGNGDPEQRLPGPGTTFPDPDVFPPGFNGSSGATAQQALQQRCNASTPPPIQALGPHVAPLGVLHWPTNTSQGQQQWPSQYGGGVFVGEHGSWNRDVPIGYRIAHVRLSADGRTALEHTVFADGWLQADGQAWGRPVGLLRLPDGSMLVADDAVGAVYRISYSPSAAPAPAPGPPIAAG